MDWPEIPIENLPAGSFEPRFCPRPECVLHPHDGTPAPRFARASSYTRKCDGRTIPRFRCPACRRRCSQQSFATSYYLKRPDLLHPVAMQLVAGSAHRQIARTLGCAPSTVTRLSARLGRHALLLQALALEHLPPLDEPIVVDHFETFVVQQEEALGLATPTGQDSWFVYGIDPAPHRRGGRRTPAQARKARSLPPPPRHSVVDSFARVLDLIVGQAPEPRPLSLITDGHPAYRAALGRHPARERIVHRSYPNPRRGPRGSPRSATALERDGAMFAVDLLHKIMRHSLAHARRETIAFARRTNAAVERGFVLVVWRNFVKGVSERKPDPTTPAMRLGLTTQPWQWSRLLAQRLFPARRRLPRGWAEVYRREWITESIGPNTRHAGSHTY